MVAVTGDVVKKDALELPEAWNSWPQPIKLAIPGNHGDHSMAFRLLDQWQTTAPWAGVRQRCLFVCLGIKFTDDMRPWLLNVREQSAKEGLRAVVVLSHCRPRGTALDSLRQLSEKTPLLILHGDEHPKGFSGLEWRTPCDGEGVFRSNVCSSPPYREDGTAEKGLAHVIQLCSNGEFTAIKERG